MKKIYLLMATAALLSASCSNNENEWAGEDTGQRVPVAFNASMGVQVVSRAVDQTWTTGDGIGIYMVENGGAFTQTNIKEEAENVRYVVASANSGAVGFNDTGTVIYYPMDNSHVDFYAYYPQGTAAAWNTVTSKYEYAIDVSTQTNQEALDFMYSNNVKDKYKTEKTAAALSFQHKLCKVVLTVQPGGGVSDLTGLTVKVKNQKTKATFSLTGNTLSIDATDPTDITLKKQESAYVYEAILLPETTTTRTFEFDLNNGNDDPFTWDMSTALVGGNKYAYTVKLTRTGMNVSGQIDGWGDGTSDPNGIAEMQ